MIKKLKEYKEIVLNLLKLSSPILVGNVSQILVSFSDNIVAGRYSTVALGAISVASAIVMTVIIGAIGLVLSISPVIANFRGQNIRSKKFFKLTLLFSFVVSIPFFLILEFLLTKIDLIGLSPDIVEPVKQYIAICAWSVFPSVLFVALKEFLQAYEKVVFANILMLLMVILNVILNVVLTFGVDFSFIHTPALGVIGLSIATLATKVLVALFMLLYCLPLFRTPFEKSKAYVCDLVRIGTPISIAIFFEFLGFNLTAVLIGKFSSLFAAVHNIVLCIANFNFMIVLSIANAASIKVGFYNGKKDKENIIKYSIANVSLCALVCLFTLFVLVFGADKIISIFSTDADVIRLSKEVLIFAIAFLFFDGIQGASVGILKGLKDTKIIMITMVLAYALIAIPLGSYLAFSKGIVLKGYWLGLALALLVAAIVTSLRVVSDIKKMGNNVDK